MVVKMTESADKFYFQAILLKKKKWVRWFHWCRAKRQFLRFLFVNISMTKTQTNWANIEAHPTPVDE